MTASAATRAPPEVATASKDEPITLERDVKHDVEFEQWANKGWNVGSETLPRSGLISLDS